MRLALLSIAFLVGLITMDVAIARGNNNYSQARRIVDVVFPNNTQDLMLRVAGCETGERFNPNAKNASGATGYFQILLSHSGTTYSYNGISITVDGSRLTNPWYNTRVAFLMSRGGTDLSPWYSSRQCWG